jgi:hypothetical protein
MFINGDKTLCQRLQNNGNNAIGINGTMPNGSTGVIGKIASVHTYTNKHNAGPQHPGNQTSTTPAHVGSESPTDGDEGDNAGRRLHVSNIPFRFRDPDLRAMFSVCFFSHNHKVRLRRKDFSKIHCRI